MDRPDLSRWLPLTRKEMLHRGWERPDVIIVTGDAYVDHPSFGGAVIGRLLESLGLKVAVIAQPNWRDDLRDFKKFGEPRLFFGVTAGCMDSMVNHYTANKRLRSNDAYTPGGEAGFRPDYAATVYARTLKQLYPDTPVVLGGIEASLRRFTHYDYWGNKLMPTVLKESGADLLVYGMGEKPVTELVRLLERGVPFKTLTTIPQTAFLQPADDPLPRNKKWETAELHPHEDCKRDRTLYAENFKMIEKESNRHNARRITQKAGDRLLVVNPPYPVMKEKEMDASFDLPYTRLPHPRYAKRGDIPAWEMIKFSVTLHRGCFGGCSFCTISAHQGRSVVSRSQASVLREVGAITAMPGFKGYISDLGGPSANMYRMEGKDKTICRRCAAPSCIHPKICKNLDTSHQPLLDIYEKAEAVEGVKKAFVSSGLRHDLFIPYTDPSHRPYLERLVERHVSGRLKIAPEHTGNEILKLMRKPPFKLFDDFAKEYHRINNARGLRQELALYFIAAHPGCTAKDMADMADRVHDGNYRVETVQEFTPTPMTLATVMYATGTNPYTGQEVYVPRSGAERQAQKGLLFLHKKGEAARVRKLLEKAGKAPLIPALFGRDRAR